MKIELNWLEPIELGSSSNLRENIKNLDLKSIPDIAGVYIFIENMVKNNMRFMWGSLRIFVQE